MRPTRLTIVTGSPLMTDNVKTVDFGRSHREASRNLHSLLGKLGQWEESVLADPIKHLNMASEELARLQRLLKDAQDALRMAPLTRPLDNGPPQRQADVLYVMRDEYNRLKACETIVLRARI